MSIQIITIWRGILANFSNVFLAIDYPMNNSPKHFCKFCPEFDVLIDFIVMTLIANIFFPNRVLLKDKYLTPEVIYLN